MSKTGYVYILASKRNGTLYTGVRSDLPKRIYEHKHNISGGFSKLYNTKILVYYEVFPSISDAIIREKQIKKWNRAWKIRLIEEKNPEWNDLYLELTP